MSDIGYKSALSFAKPAHASADDGKVYTSPTLVAPANAPVKTGPPASTVTVLVACAWLPAKSPTVYVTVYVPGVEVSTFAPVVTTVIVPSLSSTAVAPASVYVAPTWRVTSVSPATVITGAVVSAESYASIAKSVSVTPWSRSLTYMMKELKVWFASAV